MRDNVGALGFLGFLPALLTSTLLCIGLAVACGSDTSPTKNAMGGAGGVAGTPSGGSAGVADSRSGASNTEAGAGGTEAGESAGAAGAAGAGAAGAAGAGTFDAKLSPALLTDARVGKPYSAALSVSGTTGDLTWSVIGALPAGLMLVADHGAGATLVGTPTAPGVAAFGIQVKAAGGTLLGQYTLRVRTLPWLLYTTPDGAAAVDLSSGTPGTPHVFTRPLVAGEYCLLYAAQPGGSQYVFGIVDVQGASGWVTNFAGAAPTPAVRLNTPLNSDSRAQYFQWSADGQRLAWTANTKGYGAAHAYAADMSGPAPGAPADLGGTLTADGSESFLQWAGSSLFFNVDEPTAGPGATDGIEQLVVNLSSFPPPKPVALTDWQSPYGNPTANGGQFVYFETLNDTGAGELRVVGVNGAKPVASVRLHAELTGSQSASYGAQLSADGSNAVFTIEHYSSASTKRLYRVRLTADGPLAPEALTDGTSWVDEVKLSPDGKRVLYTLGSKQSSADTALYFTDIGSAVASASTKVNGPLVVGGTLAPLYQAVGATWSPDATHVVYTADALQKGLREAFLVDVVNAPGNPKRLNTSLPSATSAVTSTRFSPDGSWIALYGDLDTVGINQIYLVPLSAAGPGLPQKINDPLATNEDFPFNVTWAPDGSFFGYTVYNGNTQTFRGGIVALSGGTVGPPIPVTPGHVTTMEFLSLGF